MVTFYRIFLKFRISFVKISFYTFLSFLVVILTFGGCVTPDKIKPVVRYQMKKIPTDTITKNPEVVENILPTTPSPQKPQVKSPLEERFLLAQQEFERSANVCPEFVEILKLTNTSEPLYWEVLFMICECYIIRENYEQARKRLESVLVNSGTNKGLRQKALVRLGQVYCVMNQTEDAQRYFAQLKKEFPTSLYLPLANCDVIKQ